jgi:long-chain acyl-CoA synthetase
MAEHAARTDQLNFWSLAEEDPSHVALLDAAGTATTAGELLAAVNQLTHGLRARGLAPGDAVAAVLPNSVEALQLYLACLQSGWYLVPINFHLVAPEISYIVDNSDARILVAHERFAEVCGDAATALGWSRDRCFAVGEIGGFAPYRELLDGQPTTTPVDRTCGRLMNYTGGTTGRPKGVRRPLPGVPPDEVTTWPGPLPAYGVPPLGDHVHLCCTPWYHTAPMVFVGGSLHSAHTIVLMDGFDAERMLQLIERHRVTHTLTVPTQFVRLLALPEDVRRRYDVSSLQLVAHGAAPCPPEVKRRMIDWLGPILVEYYAATEGGGTLAFSDEWLAKPGTVGRARGTTEILILDDDGNRLPAGQIGNVYLGNEGPRVEYFKDPAKTAAAHRGRYVTVGDIGYLDEDGYLFLCDRKTEMVISGGVNIYPAEIESVLILHPQVRDVAVFGIPNDEWGEEVKAVVEPAPGAVAGEELAADILRFCEGRMARYKIPRSIDFEATLPRDESGKLWKRKLRDPYWAGRERSI